LSHEKWAESWRCRRSAVFYEKVVKVKADVAAIFIIFSRATWTSGGNRLRNEAKRSSVELRSLVDSILFFWSLVGSMLHLTASRDSAVVVFSVQGHRP
jgi:hypothetical protein